MNKRKYIYLSLITLCIEIIFYLSINYKYNDEVNRYYNLKTESFSIKTRSAINTYNLVSTTIYNESINNNQILSLLNQIEISDSTRKQIIRDSLLKILYPTYIHIKNIGIRQLHFHEANNKSFVRFHRPQKFGDDLSEYRFSVKKSNETRTIYRGFEEGKIYNGFRNVFPLIYNGKHIGSVETSFSFDAIKKQLFDYGERNVGFIISKDVVQHKVFKSEWDNYTESVLSDKFLTEKIFNYYNNDSSETIIQIENSIKNEIKEHLNLKKSFTIHTKVNNKTYILKFALIKNVEQIPVAYIYSIKEDEIIPYFAKINIISTLIGLIIIPFVIILLFSYITNNHKIKHQNLELESTNNTKNKFFSIIAHDLRGPFGAIIGLSEIAGQYIQEKEYSQLERINKNILNAAQQSFNLLNNLLQWSRIQTNHIDFNPEDIHIESLIKTTISLLNLNLIDKEISVNVDIEKNIEIKADTFMFETIIRNLLSNAIKFSYPKGIINISARKEKNETLITIQDFGTGIHVDDIPKLFTIENKVSRNGTNKETGSGLGLTLCMEFIKKHNGRIWVESEINKGSTFYFTIGKI